MRNQSLCNRTRRVPYSGGWGFRFRRDQPPMNKRPIWCATLTEKHGQLCFDGNSRFRRRKAVGDHARLVESVQLWTRLFVCATNTICASSTAMWSKAFWQTACVQFIGKWSWTNKLRVKEINKQLQADNFLIIYWRMPPWRRYVNSTSVSQRNFTLKVLVSAWKWEFWIGLVLDYLNLNSGRKKCFDVFYIKIKEVFFCLRYELFWHL